MTQPIGDIIQEIANCLTVQLGLTEIYAEGRDDEGYFLYKSIKDGEAVVVSVDFDPEYDCGDVRYTTITGMPVETLDEFFL